MDGSGFVGGALEIGGIASKSTGLLKAGRFVGAPAAVVGSAVMGVQIGTELYDNYVDHDQFLDIGSRVEEATGSRTLGAAAAATVAVGDAIISTPRAAVDYASRTWTVDSDEIDWGRTVRPWRW